jgi:hypothetical protein
MANAESFDLNAMVTLYAYANDDSGKVEALALYGLTGMFLRKEEDWFPVDRTNEELLNYLNSGKYSVYRLDWEDLKEVPDPSDKRAWEHALVNKWDDGDEITTDDLEKYGHKIGSGEVEDRDSSIDSEEE